MSQITRCPACRTMFKVVPDQLRISEGWVRCGQCEEVFDAEAHLVTGVSQPDGAAEAARREPVATESERVMPDLLGTSDTGARPQPEPHDTEVRLLAEDRVLEADFPQTLGFDEAPPATADDLKSGFVDTRPGLAGAEETDSAFLRTAATDRSSGWPRALGRALLIMLSLCLVLLQAAQVLRQERNTIAAYQPALRPVLTDVCKLLACTLEPLRQVESIVIDSSAFNKIRADVYRFNLTLRNTAQIDVATPDIELTLTDVMDQAVVRKVFSAEELGLAHEVLKAASENSMSLALRVKTDGGAERIAGYRVLAFYP